MLRKMTTYELMQAALSVSESERGEVLLMTLIMTFEKLKGCNVLRLQASYGSRRIFCLSYPDICHHVSSQMDMPQT